MRRRFGLESADEMQYGVYFFLLNYSENECSRVLIRAGDSRFPSSLLAIGVKYPQLALLEGERDACFLYHRFETGGFRLMDVAWLIRLAPREACYLVWAFQWWTGSSKEMWPEKMMVLSHQIERLLSGFIFEGNGVNEGG